MFFFEKKNQKTFDCLGNLLHGQSLCFFFSKRSAFFLFSQRNAQAWRRLSAGMPADHIMATSTADLRSRAESRAFAVSMSWNINTINRLAETAARLGFNSMLAIAGSPADPAAANDADGRLAALARAAQAHGLLACVTVCLGRIVSGHPLASSVAAAFGTPPAAPRFVVDPRQPVSRLDTVLRLRWPAHDAVCNWWRGALSHLRDIGIDEFADIDATDSGIALANILADDGHNITLFSTIEPVALATGNHFLIVDPLNEIEATARTRRLFHAALLADGWAVSSSIANDRPALVSGINAMIQARATQRHSLRIWNSPADALLIASRGDAATAVVLVENRGVTELSWPPEYLPPLPWQMLAPAPGFADLADTIRPGDTWLVTAKCAEPVVSCNVADAPTAAASSGRVIISRVSPSVDEGAYAVKRLAGEWVEVEADIFSDGHDMLAAAVLTRATGETSWTRHDMHAEPNDVWRAAVRFGRLGRHEMRVEAWRDIWGNFVHDLALKQQAGLDLTLEMREGAALISAALGRASPAVATRLNVLLRKLEQLDQAEASALLLAAATSTDMAICDAQAFLTQSFIQPVQVEREAARFSSWYELFPRSQTGDKRRHGTFADVVARLPHIAAMGFDTLYFPPIHPIGTLNRKGRNNTLTPSAEDVGSPYAIGSKLGGHDVLHPELGSMADFCQLLAQSGLYGIEIALDFAIQCAPDHPWLTDHPGWFAWRPDGSIKYAENPPKKYQDIVNVDFYAADAVPDLWHALRDVVLYWAGQGIRTFRVDNPHTKPLPFWQWLIDDVKARYPEVIFLSEAFTRPKPMYHLAKVGFSQSYTYFTWRNAKSELTDYFTELTTTGVREFFRPHLFVNTPDINPLFLQTSGRAGFLIRAALAATLSGLWGVYAGFELCESEALPGREEYLDSEKFEIRPRPDRAPDDIVDEITQLNQLRREEPALQSHLGITFHAAFNDRIIYYSKDSPGQRGRILVAVSLDPGHAQSADFEVPLWLFGLADWETVGVEDMLARHHFTWTGKMQHMTLTPSRPYAIWRISPRNKA